MLLTPFEKDQRRKAIVALVTKWEKNNDTKEKAELLLVKNQNLKSRRSNSSMP